MPKISLTFPFSDSEKKIPEFPYISQKFLKTALFPAFQGLTEPWSYPVSMVHQH